MNEDLMEEKETEMAERTAGLPMDPGPKASWRARKKYNDALREAGITVTRGKKAAAAEVEKPAKVKKPNGHARVKKVTAAVAPKAPRRVKVKVKTSKRKYTRRRGGAFSPALAPLLARKAALEGQVEQVKKAIWTVKQALHGIEA